MGELNEAVDLGAALRSLRRLADLSQRELAELSGVPQATLARIESGRATDPRFRTVERLVRAAGGKVAVNAAGRTDNDDGNNDDGNNDDGNNGDGNNGDGNNDDGNNGGGNNDDGNNDDGNNDNAGEPLPTVPHDGLRDVAGRRYPAHLDAWEVREPKDWPGAWWANWYNLPPPLWPLPVPAATYERNRAYRDRRRRAAEIRRTIRVRRVTDGLPATSWRFVAELPGGEQVGELRAYERSRHLVYGEGPCEDREIVLDGVLVAEDYRRLGIGRRLVGLLTDEMDRVGIRSAGAVARFDDVDLLLACGYQLEASRPWSLRLDRRPALAE
ncbi:Acetyltransferase (GNAT) family protein [Micromonospora citrea]|uniref:Acetyltransferase (GNAT) family protein n=1 Tax=Micromonospora citrea TaxID=47855 RepID=A0A1C6UT16_9ACTN|nr:GNAT family N-acetyltransferase [Micromonospora citrea]SCL57182.1 Acetyltransferase (GNAT) family protein [Micromonospora citrea]